MELEVNLLEFFSEEELSDLAKEIGFVKRKSPITGFKFLLTFTTGLLNTPDATLGQMASYMNSTLGTDITPQGIDDRIKENAKEFLKACLEKAIAMTDKAEGLERENNKLFEHIYIIDSTNFDLHPKLSNCFKGYGGSASPSSMRIQLVYDYLSGKVYVEIGDVTNSDSKTLHEIVKEQKLAINGPALFIFDLGYFKNETFLLIDDKPDQFFISKLKNNLQIQDLEGNAVNLKEILENSIGEFQMIVRIGKLKCRLLGKKLPESIINQRLRKVNQEYKRKGKTVSKEYKFFLTFALFISNLPEQYNFDSLYTLYRVRWQIELIFKTWKTILGIHKIRTARPHRLLCEVFGKLIIAVLIDNFSRLIESVKGVNLSFHRVLRHIQASSVTWAISINSGLSAHRQFLEKTKKQLLRTCKKKNQPKKKNIEHLLTKLIYEHVNPILKEA